MVTMRVYAGNKKGRIDIKTNPAFVEKSSRS
jgi:hypothetical protein